MQQLQKVAQMGDMSPNLATVVWTWMYTAVTPVQLPADA